jgi:hypothetical protein
MHRGEAALNGDPRHSAAQLFQMGLLNVPPCILVPGKLQIRALGRMDVRYDTVPPQTEMLSVIAVPRPRFSVRDISRSSCKRYPFRSSSRWVVKIHPVNM